MDSEIWWDHHVTYNVKRLGVPANEVLPYVHRVSSLLKRWLLGTYQGAVSKALLDHYLDEFVFRHNRRYSRHRGLLFYRLISQAASTPPQPYTKLLTPKAGARRKKAVKRARKLRAAGKVGPKQNLPHDWPRRPGGKGTTLIGSPVTKGRFVVKGRRGIRSK